MKGKLKGKLKVGVLMGGVSAEREVSLKSGRAISSALRALGHEVIDIDAGPEVCRDLRQMDIEVAFLALHGGYGEDGSIQGMLEVMGLPYTGSGVLASALAMDKPASKVLFEAAGLRVPAHRTVRAVTDKVDLKLPVVVKPSREGSSVGVSIVKEAAELAEAITEALSFGGAAPVAIVEEYIRGKEINVGVLSGKALGGVEIRPLLEFYSYEAKYTPGLTQYILPPEIPEAAYKRAEDAALRAYEALGCRGAARVDMLVTEAGEPYMLEVNTIPGMTETSLLPKIAARAGLSFEALIAEMLKDALERAGRAAG